MRQIKYILINDIVPDNSVSESNHPHLCNGRYHYIVSRKSDVHHPIDTCQAGLIFPDPTWDLKEYNAFSIGIQYNGSIDPEDWDPSHPLRLSRNMKQYKTLIALLVKLRKRFPEAPILGVSEICGRNIQPTDKMNNLRNELYELYIKH